MKRVWLRSRPSSRSRLQPRGETRRACTGNRPPQWWPVFILVSVQLRQPVLRRKLERALGVLWQQQPLGHHPRGGCSYRRDIGRIVRVALGDREARIVRCLALGAGGGERNDSALQRKQRARAKTRRAGIPPGVG